MVKRGWKRKTVNQRIGQIKRIFRWGVEEAEIIPASTYQEIKILAGLKKFISAAEESTAIKPVPFDDVKKTLPFCNKIIQDMAMVQYYAGTRTPNERGKADSFRILFLKAFSLFAGKVHTFPMNPFFRGKKIPKRYIPLLTFPFFCRRFAPEDR